MTDINRTHRTVAVVVPYKFVPPVNGGQRVAYDFCLALSKRVRLFCVSTIQESETADFKVIDLLGQSLGKYFSPLSVVKLIRIFRRQNTWLCIINQPYATLITYVACKICRVKLIIYSHNLEYRRLTHTRKTLLPILFFLEFLAYRLAHFVFFISKDEEKRARRVFGISRSKCQYVPIIVPKAGSKSPPVVPNESYFSIIYFGDFSYSPNLIGLNALLFNICPLLLARCDFPYRIKVFGSHLRDVEEKCAKSDQNFDVVKFVGYVDDLSTHIRNADVMINPVHTGAGSSLKIVETISMGTTVVSARTGAEGIQIRECGEKLFLVDDRNWEQYVSTILNIRRNKLNYLATPNEFFETYSEYQVMKSVLSAINTIQR